MWILPKRNSKRHKHLSAVSSVERLLERTHRFYPHTIQVFTRQLNSSYEFEFLHCLRNQNGPLIMVVVCLILFWTDFPNFLPTTNLRGCCKISCSGFISVAILIFLGSNRVDFSYLELESQLSQCLRSQLRVVYLNSLQDLSLRYVLESIIVPSKVCRYSFCAITNQKCLLALV